MYTRLPILPRRTMTDNDSAYARLLKDPASMAAKILEQTTALAISRQTRQELVDELVDVKVALAKANLVIANIRGFLPDIQPPGRY